MLRWYSGVVHKWLHCVDKGLTSFFLDAFDYDLMVQTLRKLKDGKHVEIPVYDFSTHSRAKYTVG